MEIRKLSVQFKSMSEKIVIARIKVRGVHWSETLACASKGVDKLCEAVGAPLAFANSLDVHHDPVDGKGVWTTISASGAIEGDDFWKCRDAVDDVIDGIAKI